MIETDSDLKSCNRRKNLSLPLTHLSMRQEKPNAIATYFPKIEDEFLPSKASEWRREEKNSEKGIKRKSKKLEKEAVRELKKDNE